VGRFNSQQLNNRPLVCPNPFPTMTTNNKMSSALESQVNLVRSLID